jgi:hypothetical protein
VTMPRKLKSVEAVQVFLLDGDDTPKREVLARRLAAAGVIQAQRLGTEPRQLEQLRQYQSIPSVNAYGVMTPCPDGRGERFKIKVVRRSFR